MARPTVKSPCNKTCTLDSNNVCIGCGRTIEEITSWATLTNKQAQQIINRLNNSKEQNNEKGN